MATNQRDRRLTMIIPSGVIKLWFQIQGESKMEKCKVVGCDEWQFPQSDYCYGHKGEGLQVSQNACPKCGKEMLAMFHCEFCSNPIKPESTSLNKDTLEQYIDKYGLSETLSHISDVCYSKAEHLRSNWQDENSASVWEKDAKKIMALSVKVEQY